MQLSVFINIFFRSSKNKYFIYSTYKYIYDILKKNLAKINISNLLEN